MRRCATCGNTLPKEARTGRPSDHCATERCGRIHRRNRRRTTCARCGCELANTLSARRAAICGACFVDLCDLAGIQISDGPPVETPDVPRLTPSQLRYRRFLASGSALPFGEWLKQGAA